MSDISTVTVNNTTYNLKDTFAREELKKKADIIIASNGGHVATFKDGCGDPALEMIVRVVPNQAGLGDPTPSNVRPITGWTGMTIKRLGKNLFNANNWVYTGTSESIVIDDTNAMTIKSESYLEKVNYYILPNITSKMVSFDYSVETTSNANAKLNLRGYRQDGTFVDLATITLKSVGFTDTVSAKIPEDVKNIRFGNWGYSGTVNITNIQIESDSRTEYEAYDEKDTISVDWSSQIGTVYGADVNVTTGTITKTYEIVDLGTLNWAYHNQYPVFYAPLTVAKPDGICYCEQYINGNTNTSGKDNRIEIGKYGWFVNDVIICDSSKGTDAAAFKEAMNGVLLVYELRTPGSEIQIEANEVQTVAGLNNFVVDAGSIYLTYRAVTKPYVDKGKVYFVKGTQTSSTNAWTGELPEVEELYEGLTINYWLSVAGTSTAATLDLTLKNGVHTGPIPMYYSGTTRQTTHLPANNYGQFIYQTVCIGNSTLTGWWMLRCYQDGNTTDIVNLYDGSAVYKAHSVIYRYELLFQVSEYYLTPLNNVSNATGTTKAMLTDVAFNAFGKIFYYYTTGTVNPEGNIGSSNVYYHRNSIDARYTFNCGQTLTAHKNLYLKVIPQGNGMVKLASDPCWVQELPSTNDNCWYIFLGKTYSTYQIQLHTEHPVFGWIDDGWKELFNPNLAPSTTSLPGLMSVSDKTKLNGIETGANNYTLPTASTSTLGGIKIGEGLSIDGSGVVSVDGGGGGEYVLPKASATTLGGIKVGANLSIDASSGVLSAKDTKYTVDTASIGSASAGTAISADDITSWDAGSAATLGTAIAADDITAWSEGTLPNATVDDEVLTLTFGTLPSLSYTPRSIPNVTSTGTAPTLQYTPKTIPNITVTSTTVATGITEQ